MKYFLKINAMGMHPELSVDREEYQSLRTAHTMLSEALAMEEKYEILISNHLDIEKELLSHAVQLMLCKPQDYDDIFQVRIDLNRKMVNLLTAARLYVDQLHQHVIAILAHDIEIKQKVKSLFAREYDNFPEYRFMEALRNYVQHSGMPVHRKQFREFVNDAGGVRQVVYAMEMSAQKEYLQQDDKFKKKILEEMPDEVDLKDCTRVYVECISRVHSSLRDMAEEFLNDAGLSIDRKIRSYMVISEEKWIELRAFAVNDDEVVDSFPLMLDWENVRLGLIRRNEQLVNLRNRYVTGQIAAKHG